MPVFVASLDATEFILGETKPNALNTGLSGPTLITISGSGEKTYTTANEVVENTRFEKIVNVNASGVTFRNCEFVGPPADVLTGRGLLNIGRGAAVTGVTVERCKIRSQFLSHRFDGVSGNNFTITRCDISGVDDCLLLDNFETNRLDVVANGNYFHDMYYTCPNSGQSDNGSHNDAVQAGTGDAKGITLRGNMILGVIDKGISTWSAPTFDANGVQQSGYRYYPGDWALSCFLHGQGGGANEDIIIDKNWIDKAYHAFIVFGTSQTSGSNIQITNNRWGRSHAAVNDQWTVSAPAVLPITITGNYFEDTGEQYNGRKNA